MEDNLKKNIFWKKQVDIVAVVTYPSYLLDRSISSDSNYFKRDEDKMETKTGFRKIDPPDGEKTN